LTTEKYLEFDNVTKQYENFTAVSGLSFSVNKGDIFGFLGPNGAGKSTSIRMLLSLITPTSGDIKLFGAPINQDRNSTIAQVGALVEKPDFYPYLSAERNLDILARLSEVENRQAKIDEVLDLVGLTERRASKVKTFSQGMKQRLGIAQTLLHSPKLVVLDEPANGLDPQGIAEIRELILKIGKKGITIILASHLLDEVQKICSHVVVLDKGKNIYTGEVSDILNASTLIELSSDDIELLEKSLKENENIISTEKEGAFLLLKLNDSYDIKDLNQFLISKDIAITHLSTRKQSLENHFLELIAK